MPTPTLLLISTEDADVQFASRLAASVGSQLVQATGRDDARRILSGSPNLLTLWNADNESACQQIGQVIPKYVKPQRIVAITTRPLDHYPYLFRAPIFGHHWLRRFNPPATDFYPLVAAAALEGDCFGLARYFPKGTPIKKLTITQPDHKRAATDALQNYLTKQGVRGRIAALVAQAADELMMNSIMVAPELARKARMKPEEIVKAQSKGIGFEIASAQGYMGICVSDCFGMLKKLEFYQALRKHYERGETRVNETSSHGLLGVLQGGLSLLLVSTQKVETQVMVFFPLVDNFRDFKSGMRFLSMIEQSKA